MSNIRLYGKTIATDNMFCNSMNGHANRSTVEKFSLFLDYVIIPIKTKYYLVLKEGT